MRHWVRAGAEVSCGGPCLKRIAKGDPMLVIEHQGIADGHAFSWKKFRCERCADEPAPDLAPLISVEERAARVEQRRIEAMTRLTGAAQGLLGLDGAE